MFGPSWSRETNSLVSRETTAVTICNFWALLNTGRIMTFHYGEHKWWRDVLYLKELLVASPTGFEPVF